MNSNGKTDKNLLLIVIAIIALVFVTNCLLSLILLWWCMWCFSNVYSKWNIFDISFFLNYELKNHEKGCNTIILSSCSSVFLNSFFKEFLSAIKIIKTKLGIVSLKSFGFFITLFANRTNRLGCTQAYTYSHTWTEWGCRGWPDNYARGTLM